MGKKKKKKLAQKRETITESNDTADVQFPSEIEATKRISCDDNQASASSHKKLKTVEHQGKSTTQRERNEEGNSAVINVNEAAEPDLPVSIEEELNAELISLDISQDENIINNNATKNKKTNLGEKLISDSVIENHQERETTVKSDTTDECFIEADGKTYDTNSDNNKENENSILHASQISLENSTIDMIQEESFLDQNNRIIEETPHMDNDTDSPLTLDIVNNLDYTLTPPTPHIIHDTDSTLTPHIANDTGSPLTLLAPHIVNDINSTLTPPIVNDTDSTLTPHIVNDTDSILTPHIVNDTDSTLTPHIANYTDSTLTPHIANDTDSTLTPHIANDTDSKLNPLTPHIVNDTDSTLTPHIVNDTDSKLTLYIVNGTDSKLSLYIVNGTDSKLTPHIVNDTDSKLTPHIVNDTDSTLNQLTPHIVNDTDSTLTPHIANDTDSTLNHLTPHIVNDTDSTLTPPIVNDTDSTLTPHIANDTDSTLNQLTSHIANDTDSTLNQLTPHFVNDTDSTLTPHIVKDTDSTLIPLTPHIANHTDSKLTPHIVNDTDSKLTPHIVNDTDSKLTPQIVNDTDSKLTPHIVNDTHSTLTPHIVNDTDSKLTPYIVNDTDSTLTPHIVIDTDSKLTPHIVNDTDSKLTPYIVNDTDSKLTPYIVNDTDSTLTPHIVNDTDVSTPTPHIVNDTDSKLTPHIVNDTDSKLTPHIVNETDPTLIPLTSHIVNNTELFDSTYALESDCNRNSLQSVSMNVNANICRIESDAGNICEDLFITNYVFSQSEDTIKITINIPNVDEQLLKENIEIMLKPWSISFVTKNVNRKNWHLKIPNLAHEILIEKSYFEVIKDRVDLVLTKLYRLQWKFLTEEKQTIESECEFQLVDFMRSSSHFLESISSQTFQNVWEITQDLEENELETTIGNCDALQISDDDNMIDQDQSSRNTPIDSYSLAVLLYFFKMKYIEHRKSLVRLTEKLLKEPRTSSDNSEITPTVQNSDINWKDFHRKSKLWRENRYAKLMTKANQKFQNNKFGKALLFFRLAQRIQNTSRELKLKIAHCHTHIGLRLLQQL